MTIPETSDQALLNALSIHHESDWKFSKKLVRKNRSHPGHQSGIVYNFTSIKALIEKATIAQLLATNLEKKNSFHLLFCSSLFKTLNHKMLFVLNGGYNLATQQVSVTSIDQEQVSSFGYIISVKEEKDPRQQNRMYNITEENENNSKIFYAINNSTPERHNVIVVAWLKKYIDALFSKFHKDLDPLYNALKATDQNHRSALSYAIESINSIEDDTSRAALTELMKTKLSSLLSMHPENAGFMIRNTGANGHSALKHMESSYKNIWLDSNLSKLVLASLKASKAKASWYLPGTNTPPDYSIQLIYFLLDKSNLDLCKDILGFTNKQGVTFLKLLIQRRDINPELIVNLFQFILKINDPEYTKQAINSIYDQIWSFASNKHNCACLIAPAALLLKHAGEFTLGKHASPEEQFNVIKKIQQIKDQALAGVLSRTTAEQFTQQLHLLSSSKELRTMVDSNGNVIQTILTSAQVNSWFHYFIELLNTLNNHILELGLLDDYKDTVTQWLHYLASNAETSAENIQTIVKLLDLNNSILPATQGTNEIKTTNLKNASRSISPNITHFLLTKVNSETKNSLLHLLLKHPAVNLETLVTITDWLHRNNLSEQNATTLKQAESLLLIAYQRLAIDRAPDSMNDALHLATSIYQISLSFNNDATEIHQQHALALLLHSASKPESIDSVRRILAELLNFDAWYSLLLTPRSSKPIEPILQIANNTNLTTTFSKAFKQALLPYQLLAVFNHYFLQKQPSIFFASSFNERAKHFLSIIDYWLGTGVNNLRPSSEYLTSRNNTTSYQALINQLTAEPITDQSQQRLAFQPLYIAGQRALSMLTNGQKYSLLDQFCQTLTDKLASFAPRALITTAPDDATATLLLLKTDKPNQSEQHTSYTNTPANHLFASSNITSIVARTKSTNSLNS